MSKKPPNIPKVELDSLARKLYPSILKYYESEEGQKAFEEWKERRMKKMSRNEIITTTQGRQ